ncbi:MAG: Trx7/PDZ domain-containing (seleno)protein [Planctomycetaceae bacterium]
MSRSLLWSLVCCLGLPIAAVAQQKPTREQLVRQDKQRILAEGFWIYNDLDRAFAEARKSGKPLLVVLRCLPCEECVKLDDELIDQDPVVKPLLEKFVCARIVGTNGLDLATFQFDTDQSFAVFLLNADGTIYGRFGTRSHRTEWVGDVSVAGMARALEGALELHADYPANKASLAGKRGPKPVVASPEKFASLKDKFTDTLNYEGDVVRSCIHCHQIGDALRDDFRRRKQPIPEEVFYPYPHPKSVGLTLDPKERATVTAVAEDSYAAAAGFKAGDRIETLEGQPLLSVADVQWVLHQASPDGATLTATVVRKGSQDRLTLKLPRGWRRQGDIQWRSSTWGMRRMATGGLKLEVLPDAERRELRIPSGEMALRVQHVGQYGPHAAAKQRGFQQGDIIVSYDGRRDLLSEADLLFHGLTDRNVGDEVAVSILRKGRPQQLKLPMQE